MERIQQMEKDLASVVAELQPQEFRGPTALQVAENAVAIVRHAEVLRGLTARRVVQTKSWRRSGAPTPQSWLAKGTGEGLGHAKKTMDQAKRISATPAVASAWRSDQVSTGQASRLVDVAAVAPAEIPELIVKAQTLGDGEWRRACARAEAAADSKAANKAKASQAHNRRFLRFTSHPDGSGRMYASMPALVMARMRAVLDPFHQEQIDRQRHWNKTHKHPADRNYDSRDALLLDALAAALFPLGGPVPGMDMRELPNQDRDADRRQPPRDHTQEGDVAARQIPQGQTREGQTPEGGTPTGRTPEGGTPTRRTPEGRPPTDGGVPGSAAPRGPGANGHPAPRAEEPRSGDPGRRRARRLRRHRQVPNINLTVDLLALRRDALRKGEICEIDGQGPVPLQVLKDILPESTLRLILKEGPDVRQVVHLGRRVTAKQRVALFARDQHCVVPGCSVRTGLEIDHVTGWRFTHRTELSDLALLCHEHHRQKTFHEAQLFGRPGKWRWIPPPRRRPAPRKRRSRS